MKKPPNRQKRIKRIKKELAALWSKAVRGRDGNRCVMCGDKETPQAHHYLFTKAHSMALAFDIRNGVTLCFSCHIIKIHRRGDGDFVMKVISFMSDKIGYGNISDMQEIVKHPHTITLEEFEEKKIELERYIDNLRESDTM